MSTRPIMAMLGLCLGGERAAADCAASSFAVTHTDSTPIFTVDLHATVEGLPRRLTVSETFDHVSTPAEGCLAGQTVLWTIEGDLGEVTYGDADGAAVFIDETDAAPLEDGRIYRARVQLIDGGEALSCADDWSISWVQGSPGSTVHCNALAAG